MGLVLTRSADPGILPPRCESASAACMCRPNDALISQRVDWRMDAPADRQPPVEYDEALTPPRRFPDMPKKDLHRVANGQRVVVIDGLSETAQVLKAVLEPRGMQVERVRGNGPGDYCSLGARPSVVVLDEDSPTTRLCLKRWRDVPHVIIGSAEVGEEPASARDGRFLQKPFQYRELIKAIEQLLADLPTDARAA